MLATIALSLALTAEPVPAVKLFKSQKEQYRELYEWAKKHPHTIVAVYVNTDPTGNYIQSCRYDAGWPNLKGPWVIYANFSSSGFLEVGRESLAPRATYQWPVMNWIGNCVGNR